MEYVLERNSNLKGLAIMLRVIFALVIRETKTRYGRLKIGYLWAFLEPLFFVFILSFIFSYIRSFNDIMPATQFFLTGVLSVFLFQHIVTQTMMAIGSNLSLLYYPQVQIIDLGIARVVLEIVTFFVVLALLTFTIWFAELETVAIEDPFRIILATLMITAYGYGVGTALGALVPLFPSLQFLAQIVLLRPLFFISGVFFTADTIPQEVRDYALLNPMLQLTELMRSAYFDTFESEYVDYHYLTGFILVTVFFGLLIQRALRRYAYQL